jgi:hypothetical protein
MSDEMSGKAHELRVAANIIGAEMAIRLFRMNGA